MKTFHRHKFSGFLFSVRLFFYVHSCSLAKGSNNSELLCQFLCVCFHLIHLRDIARIGALHQSPDSDKVTPRDLASSLLGFARRWGFLIPATVLEKCGGVGGGLGTFQVISQRNLWVTLQTCSFFPQYKWMFWVFFQNNVTCYVFKCKFNSRIHRNCHCFFVIKNDLPFMDFFALRIPDYFLWAKYPLHFLKEKYSISESGAA